MIDKVTIELGRRDTYRNLLALCNRDALFGFRQPDSDDDLEALTICDLQRASQQGGRAKGAIIGTVRLLPARDNTILLFDSKDALWRLPISHEGMFLFEKFIQRVITHFRELNLVTNTGKDTDVKSESGHSNPATGQLNISQLTIIVVLGGSGQTSIFLDDSQQVNQSGEVNLNSEGDTTIGGDVAGRDKIDNTLQ